MQCCGSGMFIPDPESWFSYIPDLGSNKNKGGGGGGDFLYLAFFCGNKFHKTENIFMKRYKKSRIKLITDPGTGGQKAQKAPDFGNMYRIFQKTYRNILKKKSWLDPDLIGRIRSGSRTGKNDPKEDKVYSFKQTPGVQKDSPGAKTSS